jgi:hypothetical protein
VSKNLSIVILILILTGREHVEVILGLADNDGVSSVVATLYIHCRGEKKGTVVGISPIFI